MIPGDDSFTHSLSLSITCFSSSPPSLCVCQAAVGEEVFVMGDVCVQCLSLLSAYLFILISSRSHSVVAEVGEYVCLDKMQTHTQRSFKSSLFILSLSLFHQAHMLVLASTPR